METLLDLPPRLDAHTVTDRVRDAFNQTKAKRLKLMRASIWSVRGDVLRILVASILLMIGGLASPLVLRELLQSIEGKLPQPPAWLSDPAQHLGIAQATLYPLLCCGALFFLAIISLLAVHHLFNIQVQMAIKVHTAVRALVFEKCLKLARAERPEVSNGAMINLVATDCSRILNWTIFLHALWYHPVQISIAMYLLYQLVGTAALYGAAMLVLPILISALLLRIQNKLRRKALLITDKRVGLTNEVLSHIKTVKFQAWEKPLSERLLALRDAEIRSFRVINVLASFAGLASNIAPTLAMLATFTAFILHGGQLDAATVFPAMSFILFLRFALNTLPDTIFNTMEAYLSFSRLEAFFKRPEFIPRVPTPSLKEGIEIDNASFEWTPHQPALSNVSLSVGRGELVAIVGGVGSGKSALLLGILNELITSSGSVKVSGSLGYVAQQPWIVSDTIRNNIIADKPFDEDRYRRAVTASGLEPDLRILPQGENTVIGERGVNLSGGQRQRVALARTLYRGADIYLLDDPLSALDPGVANSVFDKLICGEMGGATRILVTHRIEYALRADRILVIENGKITESGSPRELKDAGSRFSTLLAFHNDMTTVQHSTVLTVEPGERFENEPPTEVTEAEAASSTRSIVEEEERDVGAVNKGVIKSYLSVFMPGFLGALVIGVVLTRHFISLSTDLWLALFSQGNVTSYTPFLAGYCALALVLAIFHLTRWYLFLNCGLIAGRTSHAALLKGVIAAPIRFFESNPVGRIVNRFSRDLETIESVLPRSLQDTTHCFLDIAIVCGMLVFIEPWSLLVLLPIFYSYYRIQTLFRPSSREAQRLESISRSPVFGLLSESLAGVDTIRASSLTTPIRLRMDSYLNNNSQAAFAILAVNRWVGVRLELLAAVIILLSGIAACTLPSTSSSAAVVGLLLSYAIPFGAAMNWLVRSISQAENNFTSYERISFYANTPSERQGGILPPVSWPSRGEIRFHGLTVRYRPELPPALSALSCRIPGGARVGVIGRTGSGKSTLVLSLSRILEPSAGHTEIDGINTSTIPLESLRKAVTVVPQEPVLFSGSLRDTLDPFRQSTDEEIFQALRRVELDRVIAALPGGLSATVDEGGANFSCGQRQLLCLARALLRNSSIIVLDEATASIDVETDFAIQRTIRREFKGATVLVIAHRLGTVIDSDQIMVLEQGRLAEFGAPEELLSQRGSILSSFIHEMQRGTAA